MGWHLGSGGQENTVKTRKNDESNFHLKGGSRQGPTKQSWALSAEGCHREGSLAQTCGGVEFVELFSKIDCSDLGVWSGALRECFWGWREKGKMGLDPCWAFGREAGLR